jgi:predicted NBD/HSP70 family sugar kinase
VLLIEQTISQSGVERSRIIGVGVGASGLVNYQTGVNVLAPNLGWHSVPIKQHLENALNLPTTVDNNVRAMAVGEAFFGLGRDVDSIAFVYGRVGVGAGFVFDGKVFRGSSTGAGEIGHMIMLPKGGETCRCGNRGCLETLVSEPVIVKQALLLAKKKPNSLLASYLTNNQNGSRPIERIFEAARQGDTATCEMIQERAAYLGLALANLVNMLNPDLIILGGVFAQGQDLILPTALKTLQETAFGHMGEKVRLQTTGFGWNAGVIGAAALALINFFYYQAGQA